jgi:hypothetical protein
MSVRRRRLPPAAFVLLGLIRDTTFAWIKIAGQEVRPGFAAWGVTLGAADRVARLELVAFVAMTPRYDAAVSPSSNGARA